MIPFSPEVREIVARHPGSQNNLGPFLDVVTWMLLVTSFLAVGTRLGTKKALRRRIDVDDYLVVGALVCLLYPLALGSSLFEDPGIYGAVILRKRFLICQSGHERRLWSRGRFSDTSRWAWKRHGTAVKSADCGIPESKCILPRIRPLPYGFRR